MNGMQKTQQGISTFGFLFLVAIFAAGGYIGLQYLPQYIECGTVDSILESIEKAHNETPLGSVKSIEDMIGRQLDINQMDELRENFTVTQDDGAYIVDVSYERELNLVYEKRPMKYEKSITLK